MSSVEVTQNKENVTGGKASQKMELHFQMEIEYLSKIKQSLLRMEYIFTVIVDRGQGHLILIIIQL